MTDEAATTPRKMLSAAWRAARAGGRVGRRLADLPEQVDQQLGVAHEVPAREVLVGQHVVERAAGGPGVGQGEEAGIGRPGQGQAGGLLVHVQVGGQLVDLA